MFVAAGCGSASGHPSTMARVAASQDRLKEVQAAFATQGITLRKMLGRARLVVLVDSQWNGPFGYQRVGHKRPSVTQFLVFVRDGPHTTQHGNVWVAYGDGEGPTVKAALHQLALSSRH